MGACRSLIPAATSFWHGETLAVGPGQLNQPGDMAITASGINVIDVTFFTPPRIVRYDSSGTFLLAWAPSTVSLSGPEGTSRIEKFAADGTSILVWGQGGSGPGQLSFAPSGLAIDLAANVYAAGGDKVIKFRCQ
jgi:hypothetical protein